MDHLPLWDYAHRRSSIPSLSKSRILSGMQCAKRLYLETYDPDAKDPVDLARQAILETGRAFGRAARGRYPGGVAIEDGLRHDRAVEETATALSDPGTTAIYEAAFTHAGIRVRVDMLAREKGRWNLVEVKSSTGLKEDYVPDIAIQLHVVEGAGIPIGKTILLHVNDQYVWDGGDYDADVLFAIQDLTSEARKKIPYVLRRIEQMRAVLQESTPPVVLVGPHCRKPYRCPFHDHCHEGGPEHRVTGLPKLSPKIYEALVAAAVQDIREIPEDFDGLNDLQRRVRNAVRTGKPYVHPDLPAKLRAIRYPVHFLDFETCNPPLPIIPGTRPFQQTPFLWSDHVLAEDGSTDHRSYIHPDRTDPRQPLVDALLAALDGEGSVVVYSGFEGRVLSALAEALPAYAERLHHVASRIVDLHELIVNHYYHPEFRGSFSIKRVLPVLVEGLDYSDLMIREGSQAALAFSDMTDPRVPKRRREALRDSLLAYCRRDTLAMVRLFQTLKEVS